MALCSAAIVFSLLTWSVLSAHSLFLLSEYFTWPFFCGMVLVAFCNSACRLLALFKIGRFSFFSVDIGVLTIATVRVV